MATDFPYIETNHYHYVTFTLDDGTSYNSYVDFGLYLETPVQIPAPEPNTYMIEVPGRNGSLDLTESAIGGLTYKDRKIEFPFLCRKRRREWNGTYHKLLNSLHGKHCQIVCSDDPEFYYEGRVFVSEFGGDEHMASPSVTATVKPFKTKLTETEYSVSIGLPTDTLTTLNGEATTARTWAQWTPTMYGNGKVQFGEYTALRITYMRSNTGTMTIVIKDTDGNTQTSTPSYDEKSGVFRILKDNFSKISWDKISEIRIEDSLFPRILSVEGVFRSNATIKVGASGKPAIPTIYTDNSVYMAVNGAVYTVSPGGWENENVVVQGESTEFAFGKLDEEASYGDVKITYREGWL